MPTKKNKLGLAVRDHLGIPTTLAVSFMLASSAATHAALLPQINHSKPNVGPGPVTTSRELLFIDHGVTNPEQLLINLKPGVETVFLAPDRDGLEQITEVLEKRQDISAIHIVAHGESGELQLGNTSLATEELSERAAALQSWFVDTNLAAGNPDILLYACNLAQDGKGAAFVQQLALLTGADVAASTDITGAGGDWDLEVHLGTIETPLVFRPEDMAAYPYRLATFTVTKTADTDDGTCDADCSLREAIAVAELNGGADTIEFDGLSGTITLTLGEIDIGDDLTINGPGASTLAISGNDASRIFNVNGPSSFTLRDLTLRNGFTTLGGGAMYIEDVDSLKIVDSVITNNSADDLGGGIYIYSGTDLVIRRTEISGNESGEYGGGIAWVTEDSDEYLTIEDSLITNNTAEEGGGGISVYADDAGGTLTVSDSTISNNRAYEGGGIDFYSDDDGYLIVENSTISGNYAREDGGGIAFYSDDGALTITNSTISGNTTPEGGGGVMVEEAGSGVTIANSTIVRNTGGSYGGGIYAGTEGLNLENSIVADNAAPNGPDIYGDVDATYSLIGSTSDANVTDSGGNILDQISRVSPDLSNSGGPTKVHRLLVGSPAINAGAPGSSSLDFDQRGPGFPRIDDGRLDMGAVDDAPVPPRAVPTLQSWSLVLLGLLLPGVALRYRRRLERKKAKK